MEANRPDPVNLQQFSVGERRFDVMSKLGPPQASEMDGIDSCDMYKLVTHGVSRAGKAAIMIGEAAADVYTLGLAEIVATPAEGATKNIPHNVVFCYSEQKTLDSITEAGPKGLVVVLGSPKHEASAPSDALAAPATPPPASPSPSPAPRPLPPSSTVSMPAKVAAPSSAQ
jgi:hypothetical protein